MGPVFTVGHGDRPVDELLELLRCAGVTLIVDVRAYPSSRRHPQFRRELLAATLAAAGLGYRWEGRALGGFRRPSTASPHTALPPELRGFADHMGTDDFHAAVAGLVELAGNARPAVLCAERDPAQCHRGLISDALVAAGHPVTHLIARDRTEAHRLDPRARRGARGLVYDVAPGGQRALDFSGSGSPGNR